jgi:hypothetical protein
MGREARVIKLRVCKSCEQTLRLSAKDLKNHANVCKRLKALGLELPKVQIEV